MSRLIDANALKKEIHRYALDVYCINLENSKEFAGYSTAENYCEGLCEATELIDNLPTIDAVPVVHGHWILEREPDGKPYCFHCSVCDDDFHHIGIKSATDYCPNCGAKMHGLESGNEH